MARAVLEIVGDTGPLLRALGQVPGHVRKVASAIRGEFRGAFGDAGRSADAFGLILQRSAAKVAKAESDLTRVREQESARRQRTTQGESSARVRLANTERQALERSERAHTSALEREARRRVSVARQQHAGTRDASRDHRGSSASDAVGLVERGVTFFAGYGDDIRAASRQRAALEHRATVLASGELQDPAARGEIMTAVRTQSERTGIDPTDVLSTLEGVQANFSALGNAADRASYLGQVLPMLADAAVASGTKLSDMADAAGEYGRQFNISARDMPRAIAGQMAQGRLGSISFKDSARHAGTLAGAGTRFLSTSETNRMRSASVVGALFQTAGKGGGGGDVSATRARAFLDNFSSDRGRGRLRELLGYNAFDQTGQLRAREGENQSDALARVFEDAYRASGGNASRFGVAVGGVNTRSRALTDQLFRDMQAHGGRATDYRALAAAGANGDPANTGRSARDALGTEASRGAQREARRFWSEADPQRTWAPTTQRTIDEVKTRSPFLGKLLDNAATRGTMDLLGAGHESFQSSFGGIAGTAGPMRTRRDMFRRQAETEVLERRNSWRDSVNPLELAGGAIASTLFGDLMQANAEREIEGRTAELITNARARGVNVDRELPATGMRGEVRLATGSSVELGPQTVAAIGRAVAPSPGQVQQANTEAGLRAGSRPTTSR